MHYYLTGVEQNPQSDLVGRVAVPLINLWSSPERKKVVAKAKHGARVRLMHTRTGADGRAYHLVSAGLLKTGWVSENFIQKGE